MTYSAGNDILASDYNNLAWGGTQGTYTTSPNNVAYVMGEGSGAIGYGQNLSQINTVTDSNTITAAQWSGLVYLVNRALGHQGGTQLASGGNINMTAGETITAFANVSTAVGTINTNYASFGSQGSTTTGTTHWGNVSADTNGGTYTHDLTVTFASVDNARHFFNAGGQLNLVLTWGGDSNTGSANSVERTYTALGGLTAFRNTTNGGRTGSGQTHTTNTTSHGYRNNTASPIQIQRVTDATAAYTASYAAIDVWTSDAATTGSYSAVGSTLKFRVTISWPDKTWDDSVSVNMGKRIDIVYPETTYLTNSWGTPSVSAAGIAGS